LSLFPSNKSYTAASAFFLACYTSGIHAFTKKVDAEALSEATKLKSSRKTIHKIFCKVRALLLSSWLATCISFPPFYA